MSKILFLANHFIVLYSFRKELIIELLSRGNEVYLSLPKSDDNIYFSNLGCKIVETEIDRRGVNIFKDLKLLRQYKKIIKEIKPDIVFSYTIKPNIYGGMVCKKLKCKQVCNITGTGSTFLKKNIIYYLCLFLYKISVKKCYKLFFQNKGDMEFFIKNNLANKNYELLPGSGCNLKENEFCELPQGDEIKFIFAGRVMKLKGIDEYLECAKIIKEKHPNVIFYIAGWNEDAQYKNIVNKYQESGYVEYIGFRKDVKEWIRKCHCAILPSHGGEGVPNFLLESAAAGRVCIGSSVNGIVDVIDDGETGFLFKPSDVSDLVEKVKKFINLSHAEMSAMGLAGREKVEKEFDRQIVVDAYLREIKEIETEKNETL